MILALVAAMVAAQPQTLFTVDPQHRLIEGVATDGKAVWVSSLIDRQILQCAKRCKTIATLPEVPLPLPQARTISSPSRRPTVFQSAPT